LDTIRKLEEHKSDLDHVDNNGQTPIFYAIKHNKVEVCEYLLRKGAKPITVDNKGVSVMQFAKRHNK